MIKPSQRDGCIDPGVSVFRGIGGVQELIGDTVTTKPRHMYNE